MLALEQTGTDRHFAELSETKAESSDTATRWGTSNSRTYLLPDKTYRLVSSLIKCNDRVISHQHCLVSAENTTDFPEANRIQVAPGFSYQKSW